MSPTTARERAARLRVTFYDNEIEALEREAQASLATHPRDPVALAYLARALFKEGRFQEAATVLAKIPATDAEGQVARGDYYDYVGELPRAQMAYQKALQADPENVDALLGLATVHLTLEELEEADHLGFQAAPFVPKDDPSQQARLRVLQGGVAGLKASRGGLFEKLRWGPGVLHAFEQGRRLCPRSPYPLYALGRFYLQAPGAIGGGLPNAIAAFRSAIALDPFYHRARAELIQALEQAGADGEARELAHDFHQRFKGLPGVLAALR